MTQVRQWLDTLDLGQYADAFEENAIEWELLGELDHELLKDMGIAAAGHRLRILKAARRLADEETPAPAPPPLSASTLAENPVQGGEAERRQLTVMFCDLVGSTALSQRLDPEELREVMRAFQDRCAGAISRFGGFIARYMGDGVLVYFGYPQAFEDAPERSVRAGLDIVSGMAELQREVGDSRGVSLSVRVGIATGIVVVGDIVGEGAAAESAVIGQTPNLAARVQAEAQPDQVVVADATRERLGDRFQFQDLGARTLKGIDEPARIWRVLAESASDRVDEEVPAGARTPIVGRQEELGLLLRAWESSKAGHGQVVLLTGEPGIGKSHLVQALREQLAGEPFLWNAIRCSPYHTQSALYPIIRQLQNVLRWSADDGSPEKLAKLESAVSGFSFDPVETVTLLAELLSLPLPEDCYPRASLLPQQRRQMTLDVIVGWLFEEAERRPVLQVWEDVHWADPSTLELLDLYVEQIPTAAVLNIVTFRPDFEAPWPRRSHVTPITLNRLERPEVEAMLAGLAGGKSLPAEVVEHIADKTDGVPLYVEELSKSILASPLLAQREDHYELTGSLDEVAIPATLQDSLMSRVDRVPTVRDLVQMGAVIGREFAYEMLHALAGLDDDALREGLGQLVSEELLYQRGRPPRSRYVFKHALIQDAAYQSLLKRQRQNFHHQVAELLETRFTELASVQPELIAHHYTEAGRTSEAVDHWTTAGLRALRRWATGEATSHLRHALALLETLPPSAERDQRELAIQTPLGPALLASRGFAEPTLADVYRRAAELCEETGDHARTCLALRGRQIYHFAIGELDTAQAIAEQLYRRAYDKDDVAFRIGGHHVVGQCWFLRGVFDKAKSMTEAGIALAGDRILDIPDWPGGQPLDQCFLYAAFANWALGYPDLARTQAERGLAVAEALGNPLSLLNAEAFVAALYMFRRDGVRAQEHAERTIALSREHGHPTFIHYGGATLGAALVLQNRVEEGTTQLEQSIESWRAVDMRTWYPAFSVALVEAYAMTGRIEDGNGVIARETARVAETGEHAWDAEFHRVRAGLLSQVEDRTEAAEACFQDALGIARAQHARSFELRAATGLARLWQRQDRADEAHALLRPVYESFTEGLTTPDLLQAHALLEALRA